jgi:hypothetical protein
MTTFIDTLKLFLGPTVMIVEPKKTYDNLTLILPDGRSLVISAGGRDAELQVYFETANHHVTDLMEGK